MPLLRTSGNLASTPLGQTNLITSFSGFQISKPMREAAFYEPLTISPVAAQCNGACGKRSSIECVHIDRCWPQKSWRWRLRSTLNLDSDKFRCFNHRDELDNTVFLSELQVGHAAAVARGPAPCGSDACYMCYI